MRTYTRQDFSDARFASATALAIEVMDPANRPRQATVHCRCSLVCAMKIRPLHDRILAKRVAEADKTTGGLLIPDMAKEKPLQATVIAVGTGKRLDNGKLQELTVKAGDLILIGKYTGSEVKLDGDDHIILGEDDVLAILEG
jgi:chaperonin GroES